MKKVTSTEGNNLVALDNRIVENLCPLSLNEKRLVYLLLGRVKNSYKEGLSMEEVLSEEVTPEEVKAGRWVVGETLSSEGWYSLSVREFAGAIGIEMFNARNELEEVVESLRTLSCGEASMQLLLEGLLAPPARDKWPRFCEINTKCFIFSVSALLQSRVRLY